MFVISDDICAVPVVCAVFLFIFILSSQLQLWEVGEWRYNIFWRLDGLSSVMSVFYSVAGDWSHRCQHCNCEQDISLS